MLEIKNLTKIYTSKGNVITKALDNVSIKFPETGMVFLLGKSGSGKSTLLNLCGGLDMPDEGEIIVKGRSSKTFSGSDFDSYRNTFIGFVFQEYNILNEFSVEDNIALALELQGKSKDRKKIQDILTQVELENFAKRKPNTLSGGQKQRIAIARALIKDPEIIMADEPTGALDSNTGKQVLETLKKLSETKLVIVVSHDREFAEYYGDRIIELMDGKVISDISKTQISAKKVGNFTIIDNSTISIKQGALLSSDEIMELTNFIKTADQEIIISKDEKDIKAYKKEAKIADNGSKEIFNDTTEDRIPIKEYSKKDSTLIRSKLPLHHAFKIGSSGLRLKPFRLFLTILLSTISFVLLGVVSTMMFYDKTSVAVQSIGNSNIEYLPIQKGYMATVQYDADSKPYTNSYETLFSAKDVDRLKQTYGNDAIFYWTFEKQQPILGNGFWASNFRISNVNMGNDAYYSSNIIGFSYIEDTHPFREKISHGHYPTQPNEIMISSFTFESIKNYGLRDEDNKNLNIQTEQDIINKTIILSANSGNEVTFKITGVYSIDSLIDQKYKDLSNGNTNKELQYIWEDELRYGIFSLALVSSNFYEQNKEKFANPYSVGSYIDASISYLDGYDTSYQICYTSEVDLYNIDGTPFTGEKMNSFYANPYRLYNMIQYYFNNLDGSSSVYNDWYSSTETKPSYYQKLDWVCNGIYYEPNTGNPTNIPISQRLEYWKEVYTFLINNGLENLFKITISQTDRGISKDVSVEGFTFLKNSSIAILSEDIYKIFYYRTYEDTRTITSKYKIDKDSYYVGGFIHNKNDKSTLHTLVNEYLSINEDDSTLTIHSQVTRALDSLNDFIEFGTKLFLYVGIALTVFSILLLFNFISISITNKKREIGILRAVGARGLDVFKIFFSESFIIVLLCFLLGLLGNILSCSIINTQMGEGLSGIQLLVFGPKSILLLVAISIFVSVISTFIPVYNFAKKRPVESIRAL